MQSETGFPSSHQLKSYVAYKSRLKLAARAVLSVDAGLFVLLTLVISFRASLLALHLELRPLYDQWREGLCSFCNTLVSDE